MCVVTQIFVLQYLHLLNNFMKKYQFKVLFIAVLFSLFFVNSGVVNAQSNGYFGLDETARNAGLSASQGYETNVSSIVGNVIGTGLSLVAVLFFILMVYGGFLWMTARGDEGQAGKAKGTITAAIIGIIIVLSAYAITRFVFDSVNTAEPTPAVTPGATPASP